MQADYLANGKQKLTAPTAVTALGSSQTITEQYGSENTYKFSNIAAITFTSETSTTQPKVEVAACDTTGDTTVTFDGIATRTTTP